MDEIIAGTLTYNGSDLESEILSETSLTGGVSHLRLEVYLDSGDLREPYLITATPEQVEDGFDIERGWPLNEWVGFQAWAVPTGAEAGSIPDDPYTDRHVSLDSIKGLVEDSDGSPVPLGLDDDLILTYTGSVGTEETHIDVETPSGNTEEHLHLTKPLTSTIEDFEDETDDGLGFVDKEVVLDVVNTLASQVDVDGVDDQPDGYHDGAINMVHQNQHGYCGSASILFNFAQHYPRRLIEWCRSIYQPMAGHAGSGDVHGYLTNSITYSKSELFLGNGFRSQQMYHGRSDHRAFVDVLQTMIRYTVREVRTMYPNVDDQMHDGDGINADEKAALLQELMPVSDTSVQMRTYGRGGVVPLRRAKGAVDNDKLNTIALDATLIDEDEELSEDPSVDHAITLLDSNVPNPTSNGSVPDPIEIVFQNSWRGTAERQTHPKEDIEDYVSHVTLGTK